MSKFLSFTALILLGFWLAGCESSVLKLRQDVGRLDVLVEVLQGKITALEEHLNVWIRYTPEHEKKVPAEFEVYSWTREGWKTSTRGNEVCSCKPRSTLNLHDPDA